MDCEFCSVTAFNGHRYRRRPSEEVLAELATIPQRCLFFVDDNIIGYGQDSRQQALELFKGMVKRQLNKWWFCQASLNFADDEETLHWAGKAGCKMVFLGLEAEEGLKEMNKRLNLKRGADAYGEAFRRIHRAGIAVLGAFIFGLDGDSLESLRRRTNYILRCGVDVMQTTVLTPLPGTRLFERYRRERRLLFPNSPTDWDHYDMTEVIYHPLGMSAESLAREMDSLNARIHSWPVLFGKAFRTFWETRNLATTLFAWNSNLNYRNVDRRGRKPHSQRSGVELEPPPAPRCNFQAGPSNDSSAEPQRPPDCLAKPALSCQEKPR